MTTPALAGLMAHAANAFLEALSEHQRKVAQSPFEDTFERQRWYYTPNARPGVSLVELDAPQQQLGRQLLRSGLSVGAYNTAATIMSLEWALADTEGWRASTYSGYPGPGRSVSRDPNMYFVAIFGQPGEETTWGWTFGGHHVSVTHTIVGGVIGRPTPSFFGSNPALLPLGEGHSLRALAPEEDLGFELLHSLDSEQKRAAIISDLAPSDMVQSNRPRVQDGASPLNPRLIMNLPLNPAMDAAFARQNAGNATTDEQLAPLRYSAARPAGIAVARLAMSERGRVGRLIQRYLRRMPEPIAELEWGRIAPAIGDLHFAWAGSVKPGSPHYYRIQGPGILIEYDNPDPNGNHIHACWRNPEGDFGADLLAAHYAAAH
ncbi:MAG: DUF3500 domain-containing protein [Anaerolineaceae bacterium]